MNPTDRCPDCGTELPPDAPLGVCPKCLLRAGIEIPSLNAADAATLIPQRGQNVPDGAEPATDRGHRTSGTAPARGTRVQYFGDYELLDEIARGGMGVVYKARQVKLNRVVALKMILSGQFAGQADVQRFYAEAEAAAHLDHPGIVPVFEVGAHDGHHFFSMALVEGESLAERVRNGPLPPREAALILSQVCAAIQYAHDRGVIHRDLKPANILMGQDGQPRVTDFGLARQTDVNSHLTGTGQILGTPGYMAPEQAAGSGRFIHFAADIYSLGAVLYCLLTARPPFQSANVMDTLIQVTHEEPLSPRALNPQVPQDLATIVLKCLQKEPRKRYGSARDLAEDLQKWLEGRPITARPTSLAERAQKWILRHPAIASLSAILLGGILLFVVFLVVSNLRFQRLTADLTKSLGREQSVSYGHRISLAEREWLDAHLDRAESILDQSDPSLRGWEWNYLSRLCHPEILTLTDPGFRPGAVVFSPDGRFLIAPGTDATISFHDAKTGERKQSLAIGSGRINTLACSSDGTRIAAGITRGRNLPALVKVWDVSTGDELKTFELSTVGMMSSPGVALSADGRRLLINEGSLFSVGITTLRDLETGRELLRLENSGFTEALHPTGELVAARTFTLSEQSGSGTHIHGQKLAIHQVSTGDVAVTLESPIELDTLSDFRFSADGQLLAAADYSGNVVLWNAVNGERLFSLHEVGRRVAFSRDGQLLATVDAFNTSTKPVMRIWETKSGRMIRMIRGSSECAAFHPDGRSIAAGSYGEQIRVWNLEQEPGVFALDVTPAFGLKRVAFSPDGQSIAVADDSAQFQETIEENGNTIHRSFNKKVVSLHDVATGRKKNQVVLPAAPNQTRGLGFLDDHHLVTISSQNGDPANLLCEVACWNVESAEKIWSVEQPPTHRLWDLAVCRGKNLVAVGGHEGPLTIYNGADGTVAITINTRALDVALSQDGKLLATSAETHHDEAGIVTLWETATGRRIRTFETSGRAPIIDLAFSPDGVLLAAATSGSQPELSGLTLWNVSTGESSEIPQGPAAAVSCIAFSRDGKRLVTGSSDGTVKIWNHSIGQILLTLQDFSDDVLDVEFSGDGSRLAGISDSGARVWGGRE